MSQDLYIINQAHDFIQYLTIPFIDISWSFNEKNIYFKFSIKKFRI